MLRFGRILWTKNVALEPGELAYGGLDATVLAREPRGPGDLFELHSTPEDAASLADPEVGDLLVLTQHGQATHLAEIVGERVERRPRRTQRRGTRDHRFSAQRTCRAVALLDYDEAPFAEEAFGFEPQNEGGEVFRIDELPSFERAGRPLWWVQRRLERALTGPRTVARPNDRMERVTRELEATLLGDERPAIPSRRRPLLRSSHRGLGRPGGLGSGGTGR